MKSIFEWHFEWFDIKSIYFVIFSKYDLYTKSTKQPNIAELKEYYQKLIDKYIPGSVRF